MAISSTDLKEILVPPGFLTDEQFKVVESTAKKKKKNILDVIVEQRFMKDENLHRLVAEHEGYRFADLTKERVDDKARAYIPEIVARTRRVIAFGITPEGLKVGMIYPEDLGTKQFIEKRAGMPILPHYVTRLQLEKALSGYKQNITIAFKNIFDKLAKPGLTTNQRDEITITVVDMLLSYGYQNNASDIHIEPYTKKIMVRFRIDGVMHDILDMPKELAELIISRIKILSKMRIDEHQSAQDGKLRFMLKNQGEEFVDVRVSVVPVTEGENIVMRILSAKNRQFTLRSIGLTERDYEIVNEAILSSYGMILVTGPTGSGKTTSLYAILQILNRREVHIATIEDPVEYDIEGVSQIQVNPKTNLTFVKGLRAIVRQDPDIIMVGEIRDSETANIAVNSALTGHLVLSTLHTNNASTTLPRLLEMNIEPFLVASTVNIAVAQRLVRKVCEKCRSSYKLSENEMHSIKSDPDIYHVFKERGYEDLSSLRLYHGTGCTVCGDTGYTGRIGIFEILRMTERVKGLVIKRASSNEIEKAAKEEGMVTMMEDGIDKVITGMTTLGEVIRIINT